MDKTVARLFCLYYLYSRYLETGNRQQYIHATDIIYR